ncbi:helix-turn-helix domain-containing protein [Candidatus Poriferisocius sp.]|uniref:helix-turn-helix domain-containing protein n=1 Tax=Candidatus Poriferisocius sp. TaxID=3101276 RepID=UPI003B5B2DA8
MTNTKRAVIPDGADTHSDDDFAGSTDRVLRARDEAMQDPKFAAAVETKRSAINRRIATLAALRKARGLTQAQLTHDLGMTQGEISRLERRENLHLATLARFIEATGGRLRITAVYDDDEVEVGIGDLIGAAAGPE